MGWCLGKRTQAGIAAVGAALVVLMAPPPATAAEQIQDGGFEANACPGADCTHPFWTESGTQAFLCEVGKCGGSPRAGTHWLTLGADSVPASATETGAATQSVQIPGAPATLAFYLKLSPNGDAVEFRARIDGVDVFTATSLTSGYASYVPVTRDISGFAGPGSHTLSFEVTCTGPAPFDLPYADCSRFDIDDVSLRTPDPQGAPPSDGDGDGSPDTSDNCPGVANADQADGDADGIGDACEPPTEGGGVTPTCAGKPVTITGTDGEEIIRGTTGSDVIAALGGADLVKAGNGNDIVCAGAGGDDLEGQGGTDKLFGEGGKDELTGGAGKGDVCNGGKAKDDVGHGCEKEKQV